MKEYISYYIDQEEIYNDEGDVIGEEDYWLISMLYVPAEMRGNGVARKLMEDAIADMREKDSSLPIKLWCEAQDKDTDQELLAAFYESFDFEATGNGAEMVLE